MLCSTNRKCGWQKDFVLIISYCCCSVTQSCPTLCDPMDCSIPGFPVLHYRQEFVQTHVHWVGDAIQLSHPLIPSPPALNLYQHQSFPVSWLSASCGQSIGALASVLPMSIQDWFSLGLLVWSLCSPGDSEESSPAPQFESISSLVLSFLYDPTHILTWVLEKLLFWLYGPLLTKWCLCFSFFYFKKNLFLTDWWLAYIIGLISVIHQHEITIGVSVVESPSHLMPIPTPLGYYRLLFEFPESCSKFPLAVYLHTLVYVFAF